MQYNLDDPSPDLPPTAPPRIGTVCVKCRNPIDPRDAFCRFCGARQQVTDPFYYHPVWILILAFFVLGPFALGLVWRSRAMTPAVKIAMTAIILAYTAVTFYYAFIIIAAVYNEFSVLNQIM